MRSLKEKSSVREMVLAIILLLMLLYLEMSQSVFSRSYYIIKYGAEGCGPHQCGMCTVEECAEFKKHCAVDWTLVDCGPNCAAMERQCTFR